jgi:hypothetical protein
MATRPYHKPDNVEILDMHRGTDTSQVRFPPEGCCISHPELPKGMLVTVMLAKAKAVAKAEMQAQGIKVAYIHPREVRHRAEQLLKERWAAFEEAALEICEKIQSKKSNISKSAQRRKR